MKINTNNLFKISSSHSIREKDILVKGKKIKSFLKKIEGKNQGFYKVVDELDVIKSIENYAHLVKGKFKDIILLGIGGSSLGADCLRQSLGGLFANNDKGYPRIHIIDNIDPELIGAIESIVDIKKTLFVVVTKSGGTPETLSQFFYFYNKIKKEKLKINNHFVFITDPELGLLRKIAEKKKVITFNIPPNIGGRFSVLTPVGLLPAALIGIDIKKLLKGARGARDLFLSENVKNNLSFQLATIQYLLDKKGKTINVLMPYSNRLIKLSDWYRQLLAESIGKAKNNKNKLVNVGITPINALGATDQHSQSQLYNEGPNDKLLIFIKVNNQGKKLVIPAPFLAEKEVQFLKGVSFNKLIHTELEATADSLTKNNRPNITIEIDRVNSESLGKLFMFFEGAVAFLGEYYNIDAFNQPGVELSKNLTKKYLIK